MQACRPLDDSFPRCPGREAFLSVLAQAAHRSIVGGFYG